MSMLDVITRFINGAGYVPPPQPGNTANAPADAPSPVGNYEFIQWQMYPNHGITDSPVIPSMGVDNPLVQLNQFDISGESGGGYTGLVPQVKNGQTLYFDPATGLYISLPGA